MHCPSCGAEATMGLKYCKRCGENLSHTFQLPQYRDQGPRPGGTVGVAVAAWALALATVAITLGGFGIIFSHAFDLMRPVLPGQTPAGDMEMIAMTMLVIGSAVIFGILAMLIRVFSKLMGLSSSRAEKATPPQRPSAIEYPPAQLSSPPSPISGVTEHTTRNFEMPQYREPKARE
jgi:hypothetical protein